MLPPGKWFSFGAAADCDIRLQQPQVSSHHGRIGAMRDGIVVEDTGSTNGTFVRGARVMDAVVAMDEEIGLGSYSVVVRDLVLLATGGDGAGPRKVRADTSGGAPVAEVPVRDVEVDARPLIIGRDSDCDIIVNDESVSGRHARVFRNAGRLVLEDLGSRNGTYVRPGGQGEWVSYRSTVIRRSDVVRVGKQGFKFRPADQERRAGARLDVQDVELTVTHRATGAPITLLNGVSFSVLDGEVVGILGPSGSGKTSLLNILAGFDKPTSGRVLVQGQVLHAADGLAPGMGALVGHAPQFDVAHELLTVEEAIRFSAKIRGPANWTDAEIEQRVAHAIADVDLTAWHSTPIGSDARKTLSGGQKKRVNIAMELVLAPPILLLDEPTSGLSAQDTMELMRLLRKLADGGRTIVLTIHQPSYAAFVQMDQVLVLEEGGHVAWFGPAALDSFEYFGVTDREPGALLERLPKKADAGQPGVWASRYAQSETRKKFVTGRAEQLASSPPSAWPIPPIRDAFARTVTLVTRNLRMKSQDWFFILLTLAVPLVISALFVGVIGAQVESGARTELSATVEHQYFVIMTILCCFFGALIASLEIVTEILILRRESRGGLGLGAYLASKAIVFALPSVIFPAMALGTIHLLASDVIGGSMLEQWMTLACAFFASACAGLFLSSVVASPQGVIILAVFYAIVQVVFSVFVPLHVAYDDKPRAPWLLAASAPMTARWALGGLVSTRDLCDLEVAAPTTASQVPASLEDKVKEIRFLRECRTGMYQDHGVRNAGTHAERTAPTNRQYAIFANLLLAALALVGAGVALTKRSKGTQ